MERWRRSMEEILEKIKELMPVKIGDRFIGVFHEGKSYKYVCLGYEIKNDGLYLLTNLYTSFKYPENVKLICGETDA